MKTMTTLLAVALAANATLAPAQEAGGDGTEGMDHAAMGPDGAMGRMMAVMDAMMAAMPAQSTGKADADFLLMMIPHHQSAIDMARVEMEWGSDEAARAMAQDIIDAQEAEIAEIRAMLERMGVAAPAMPTE